MSDPPPLFWPTLHRRAPRGPPWWHRVPGTVPCSGAKRWRGLKGPFCAWGQGRDGSAATICHLPFIPSFLFLPASFCPVPIEVAGAQLGSGRKEGWTDRQVKGESIKGGTDGQTEARVGRQR